MWVPQSDRSVGGGGKNAVCWTVDGDRVDWQGVPVENHTWSELSLRLWAGTLDVVPHADCAVQTGGCDSGWGEEFRGFDACCVAALGGWDGGCEDGAGLGPDSKEAIVRGGEDAWIGCEWGLRPASSRRRGREDINGGHPIVVLEGGGE